MGITHLLFSLLMKMAIHAAIVSRRSKDFGGARILAAREEAREGAQGGKAGGGTR